MFLCIYEFCTIKKAKQNETFSQSQIIFLSHYRLSLFSHNHTSWKRSVCSVSTLLIPSLSSPYSRLDVLDPHSPLPQSLLRASSDKVNNDHPVLKQWTLFRPYLMHNSACSWMLLATSSFLSSLPPCASNAATLSWFPFYLSVCPFSAYFWTHLLLTRCKACQGLALFFKMLSFSATPSKIISFVTAISNLFISSYTLGSDVSFEFQMHISNHLFNIIP